VEGLEQISVVTLGPAGTCHERATKAYLEFQGVAGYDVEFIEDFLDGLERIRGREDAFLIQCSAHPLVHKVTERYWDEVFVVDTFIYPTKSLAVLARREVEQPRSLGLVPATAGYVDESAWGEIIDVVSKPIVARELLEGRYDAGLTHLEYAERYPEQLRVVEEIGEIDTTWVVYATRKRFRGEVIGILSPELFGRAEPVAAATGS
jgi:hypothetical protein